MGVQQLAGTGFLNVHGSADGAQSAALRRMQTVANLLDSAFEIPGTKQRVGLDAFIGLVPGVGDIATTLLSTYVIWEARNLGLPRFALARMIGNLAIHASVGAIPLLGDLFDSFFRVNQRNMRIVRAHLNRNEGR